MIHIDMSELAPSDKWKEKAEELTLKLQAAKTKAERDAIIDKNYHWRAFKEELKKMSYGKCWYSEARDIYSHYHVDHFRPKKAALDDNGVDKGGYWWLTYEWTNYRLCGSVGNTKKRDYFPVERYKAKQPNDPLEDEVYCFLDPTRADDVDLLNFDEEGKVIPANPNQDDWEYKRADLTIKWFDLNYSDLKEERKRVWQQTVRRIEDVKSLKQEYNATKSVVKHEQLKAELEKLRGQIAPCTELSSTIRCCLRSSGLDWALKLLEKKINADKYCAEYAQS